MPPLLFYFPFCVFRSFSVKYPRLGYFFGQFPVSHAMWNGTFHCLQNPCISSAWPFWDHIWKEKVVLFHLVYSAVHSDHYSISWSRFCLYSIFHSCHMSLGRVKLKLNKLPVLWPFYGLIQYQLLISWALVETAGQTDHNFLSWTSRRILLSSDGCPEPSITVSSEIEPIYRDPASIDVLVPILQPVPHWQVVLGAIAIWFVLSPKWDFQFVFKGNFPFK